MDEELVGTNDAVAPTAAPEKTLTVDQVNNIVKREKAAAAEKARRDAELSYQAEIEKLKGSMPSGVGGMPAPDVEQLYPQFRDRLIKEMEAQNEQAQLAQRQQEAERLASSYFEKISSGKQKFEDFEQVMSGFNINAFPQLVYLTADEENVPEIMYDLAQNPYKLVTINSLAQYDPQAAKREIKKLSESIKANETAKVSHQLPNAPLSQPKPSVKAGADTGAMSIADFKRQPWLRG